MLLPSLDKTVYENLNHRARQLEEYTDSDCFLYYGEINPVYKDFFVDEIETIGKNPNKKNRLSFFIHTPGGVAEAVEKMVEIMRHYYDEVHFIVPGHAFSAGTILCMSGDAIFMNYASSLGPIDPQIYNGDKLVPAQGYLDQFEKMLEKSKNGTITPIEMQLVRDLNLADLNFYDQARNLTVTLLKKWLVQYKFKDWTEHGTDPDKIGQPVTKEEKEQRAEEIAKKLGDNAYWHSHGRNIGIKTLQDDLKLRVEDYTDRATLSKFIGEYHRLAIDYTKRQGYQVFIHHREMHND